MNQLLEVKGLTKKYPNFELTDISFTLEEGRIMGLIGKNGAGKTTTLKSILNIVHNDCGRIRILGGDFPAKEIACKQCLFYSMSHSYIYRKITINRQKGNGVLVNTITLKLYNK